MPAKKKKLPGVVDALFAIATSLDRVAGSIQRLGNGDASTPMGGLEALGATFERGIERMAQAIESTRGE